MGERPDLDGLRVLEASATPGPWKVGVTRPDMDPVAFMAESIGKSPHRQLWCVLSNDDDPDDAIMPAVTGNGPTSEANADLVVVLRNELPGLLAYLAALEADLAAERAHTARLAAALTLASGLEDYGSHNHGCGVLKAWSVRMTAGEYACTCGLSDAYRTIRAALAATPQGSLARWRAMGAENAALRERVEVLEAARDSPATYEEMRLDAEAEREERRR